MGQSLSKVYIHTTFSTKFRRKLIDAEIEESLFRYIGGICKYNNCNPIQVGGYRDHVHILCTLSKNITQANLLKEIKSNSSKWIKTQGEKYSDFYWQIGYGVFSVSTYNVDLIRNYILKQEEHHQKQTYQDEFRRLLIEHDIEFDERYVWD